MKQLPDRFQTKIAVCKSSGCWVWTGARNSRGYGSVKHNGQSRQAHLVVWELLRRGGKPFRRDAKKRELDHLCRNRACVNPDHLEPVSRGENNRRSTCWHAMTGIGA